MVKCADSAITITQRGVHMCTSTVPKLNLSCMGKIKLLNNLTILAAAIRTTGTCKICLNTFTGE